MNLYRAESQRAVRAESARHAASIYARRIARKLYGRKGYCHHARLDSWSGDCSSHRFECFVGYDLRHGGTSGRNVWISVYLA